MKIKKGDNVLVISGKDKGKKAKVLRLFPKEGKILVEGVNLKKVHRRPRREGEKGQIIEKPAPLFASKVKVICDKCGNSTRVGYLIKASNEKVRICKKCKSEI